MLHIFTKKTIQQYINFRKGERKLGESVITINPEKSIQKALKELPAKYVIVGISEDIGVQMNGGNAGAHTAFTAALKAFLNIQDNQFLSGDSVVILGYLEYAKAHKDFDPSNREEGDAIVRQIDRDVSELIQSIVAANKIPIIIGGGHNNAYGNCKGTSLAKNSPIQVINMDAHTDLRRLEERHSGNGFSYAMTEGYLEKYFIFGLHENYTPQYILDKMEKNDNITYNTFEALEVRNALDFFFELKRAKEFLSGDYLGIEIDLDCIQYFASSAMTPSGFTPEQTRKFIHYFAKLKTVSYLHICEGAPGIQNEHNGSNQVGKYISYLISDFIKANAM